MSSRWMAVLALLVSSMLMRGPLGLAQLQTQPPAGADSTQNEISTQSTDLAIKVDVNLVLVRVVVRDAHGRVVPALRKEDFQVFDNGKERKISSFNEETAEARVDVTEPVEKIGATGETGETEASANRPAMPRRFLALVFDDLHMKAADAMAVRAATEKLFASLSPTDRVAIYSTQGNVQQDFTADAKALRKALAAIVPHPAKGEGHRDCPNITYYQADLISNKHDPEAISAAEVDAEVNDCPLSIGATVDRILLEGDWLSNENYRYLEDVVKHLATMPGQRVLVYVSPGFIVTDALLQRNSEWIERAVRAGVVVNTIDARGLYTAEDMPDIDAPPQESPYPPPRVDYQRIEGTLRMQAQFQSGQVLAEIAASTGGRYFHNRNDLDRAMDQALAAPEVTYVLGFTPQKPMVQGKFHSLKVKLAKGKKYDIQATNGYYFSKKPVDREEAARQQVREALLSREEIPGLPVRLTAESTNSGADSSQLSVLTHVDISGMQFQKVEGRSCNSLMVATGLFDGNGRLVDSHMDEIALKLQDSTLEKMRQVGLTVKFKFTPKPGTYRVRSVLWNSEDPHLTARNEMTEIRRETPDEGKSNEGKKTESFHDVQWAPPKVDAVLKSLSTSPACDQSEVLRRAGEGALTLASSLQRFSAQEHIDYVMLNRNGMVEEYDSGLFQYAYWIEEKSGGAVSREYRTPVRGSHVFRAAGESVGEAAFALIFLPDVQTDYEMKCEGTDQRNGQPEWVIHFQQRKDRPEHTVNFWINNVSRPGFFKGRAWISLENFQVVHLEASLMDDLPDLGLQALTVAVNYRLAQPPSSKLALWLPDSLASYWDYDAHRVVLVQKLDDFQFFTVETKEKTQEPTESPKP